MSIAIYDPPPGGAAALAPNVSQKVVGIHLNTGNNLSPFWVITGKVVVASASTVSVRAQLVAVAPPAPPTVLDTSISTIPANGSETISLEGVLTPNAAGAAPPPTCVEIVCLSPSAAKAELARLIAVPVNPATVVTC
jgi:hypothetical protein